MNEQFRKVDFTLMLISKLSSCASLFPSSSAAVPVGPVDSIHCELGKHMAELEDPSLRQGSEVNQLLFWKERQAMFLLLKPVAEDLLAVERIFFCLWDYEHWQPKSHVKVSWNKSVFEVEQQCAQTVWISVLLILDRLQGIELNTDTCDSWFVTA